MDLHLSARVGRACTVVRVGGEIDMETSPGLHDFLQKVSDGGAARVVLDFADV